MQNTAPKPKERLALLRFEVVCHVKTLRQEGLPLAECLRAACSRPWPAESGTYYSFRTIETWWYDYDKRGYGGISGKPVRADAGRSRALDEETGLWIIDALIKSPGIPFSVLYRNWEDHGRMLPSMSTARRFLKAKGYDPRSLKAGRLESGPQKAFEAPAPNDLWMVDFACGPTLRSAEGKAITTQLCVILDDHSRLISFAAYYLAGDTASFLDCLKQAVLRRGLPLKLYTDQGKPFVNNHAQIACANLGVRLLHAKPYHAWSKGKVERLIRTIQGDFEATLRLEGGHARSAFALILAGDDYLLGNLRLSIQRALFSRISAACQLQPLPREDIAPYLNWHVESAGLSREVFAPAAIDLMAEASEGNPRTLNLLGQAAWVRAARAGATEIQADHVHAALRQVPIASAKITTP